MEGLGWAGWVEGSPSLSLPLLMGGVGWGGDVTRPPLCRSLILRGEARRRVK